MISPLKPGLTERIKHTARRIGTFLKSVLVPSEGQFNWAGWAILILTILVILYIDFRYLPLLGIGVFFIFLVFYLGGYSLASLGIDFVISLFWKLPRFFRFIVVAALLLYLDIIPGSTKVSLILAVYLLILASLIGGSLYNLKPDRYARLSRRSKIQSFLILSLGLCMLLLGMYWMFYHGRTLESPKNAAMSVDVLPQPVQSTDLSEAGRLEVHQLFYGSGKDKHRMEYGDSADILTDSVDASGFVSNWNKFHGKMRTWYWGFDEKALPINGRVWYPEGKGPYPLVLIVHGNHNDHEYSDPGYTYLGEHLASRGYILVSVDMNFLNGSWANIFDRLKEENDCRGWLMLKHLEYWRKWATTEDHPLYGKVDTNNIALMGHSRGGEAVAIAAMFNQLPFYPDDATIGFNFGFNIRSVISIAPVDGQYKPAEVGTFFKNVNYFTIHGSFDMDMQSFHGARQYQRIQFTDSTHYYFKSGLYIYRANHGQFNTIWGRNDVGYPGIHLYNRKAILNADEQRKIARFYFTAFLEATLRDKTEYVPFFQDYRTARDWLPETIYLNQFEDSRTDFFCTFDEDLDVSTGTYPHVKISSEYLTVWREELVPLKWGKQDTRGVFLGWNIGETDSIPGKYTMTADTDLPADTTTFLVFALADAKESSQPKKDQNGDKTAVDSLQQETNSNTGNNKPKSRKEKADKEKKEEKDKEPIDFSIVLSDQTGQSAALPLHYFSYLQPQIESAIMKADFLTKESKSEVIFQHFRFPLKVFSEINPALDLMGIRKIQLVFDRSNEGVLVLDNLGFSSSYQ